MFRRLLLSTSHIRPTATRTMSSSAPADTAAAAASGAPSLTAVVAVLDRFAPLHLAESWDNVGLLLEPTAADRRPAVVRTILLTNDLTEAVLGEATAADVRADLIVSYHPPIFKPLTRITQRTWKERVVAGCLGAGVALYSPHTAWDAQRGGVNDWLARFAGAADEVTGLRPVQPHATDAQLGAGRALELRRPVAIGELLARFKAHIGLAGVNVALGRGQTLETRVRRVAVCAGSGASVLRGCDAELLVTGEMSHHDVLDAVHAGSAVFACNHSNSERGFLREFAGVLGKLLAEGGHAGVRIVVAESDADPLVVS